MGHAVASEGQITRLDRSAKGRPMEIDRARDRLRPDGNQSHRGVNFRPACDEDVLLHQVACKLGETITFAVTVKHRAEDKPEIATGVRGYAARPVLHADVDHATHEQAKQMKVGKEGSVGKDKEHTHCGL